DDRIEIRRLLLTGSERRYDFVEAETGAAGLALCLGSPSPGCVILDNHLPDMNGSDFLGLLINPEGGTICPVIVVTGSTTEGDDARALLRAGAHDYVTKRELSAETLARAVDNTLERYALARELRESEERFRLATTAAQCGMWDWNIATGGLAWSGEHLRLAGVKQEDFTGHVDMFTRVLHPDDRLRVWMRIERQISERGQEFTDEYRFVH